MKSKILIAFVFLLLPFASICQFKEHKWVKPKYDKNIPEELASEDAVKMLDKTSISIDLAGSGFTTTKTKFIRIKLLTERGVERYGKVYLEKDANWRITKLDARSIHPDGKITNLDKDQIINLGFTDSRNEDNSYQEVRFSIPDAKIGDIIEITYSMRFGHFMSGDDVMQHSEIPCLDAQYKLNVPSQMAIESKSYNGMADFSVKASTERVKYLYKQTNIPGLGEQKFAIPHRQIPFAVWAIRGFERNTGQIIPINSNSWNEFYNRYSSAFDNGKLKRSAEKGAFFELIQKAKQKPTNIQKVQTVVQALKKLEYVDEELLFQDLSEYITAGKINYWTSHYFITQALEQLGITDYVCFGRSKYEGMIDLNFASAHQIRYVFYGFEDEKGRIQFVFPPIYGEFLEVGEIPAPLYDTNIVLLRNESDPFKKTAAFSVNLEMFPSKDCIKRDISSVTVNLDQEFSQQTMKRSISGPFSTGRRSIYVDGISNLWLLETEFFKDKKEVEIAVDSLSFDYPYLSTFSFDFDVESKIEYLEDTLVTLPLSPFIEIEMIDIEGENRTLPLYGPHNYQHQVIIELNFDKDVKLLETINTGLSNKCGRLQINAMQKSEKQITVNVIFSIEQASLPIADIDMLLELNKTVKELVESELLLVVN